ncbi:DUF3800 domain-containing protein [Haloferula sp. A504]|uniref:DUF3800 domain-containing protein n=1 Tax=Haloferula sp. A504 TaxID=3373601 RepID=UPI00379654D0
MNLTGEIKWSKISEPYAPKYCELMDRFFEEMMAGHLKVRIMFTQNARVPTRLTAEHRDNEYFLLYYQFIKQAFGLDWIPPNEHQRRLRLYFDQFPDTREVASQFKGYIRGLEDFKRFREIPLTIARRDITEVRSHDHLLLQCLDVVLGAMSFRLNDRHKAKPPGSRVRGKRTRAKEGVYKHILRLIRAWRPGFNPGVSTGRERLEDKWEHPYRHWLFESLHSTFDGTRTKKK